MKFKITEEFFIEGLDQYNWVIVQVKTKKEGNGKGETYEDIQGYFPSLAIAKNRLAERLSKTEADFNKLNIVLDKIGFCDNSESYAFIAEIERRRDLIISEPNGLVREQMIQDLLIK